MLLQSLYQLEIFWPRSMYNMWQITFFFFFPNYSTPSHMFNTSVPTSSPFLTCVVKLQFYLFVYLNIIDSFWVSQGKTCGKIRFLALLLKEQIIKACTFTRLTWKCCWDNTLNIFLTNMFLDAASWDFHCYRNLHMLQKALRKVNLCL